MSEAGQDFVVLAVAFDSEDPEFARGFEAGAVYLTAKASDEPFTVQIRASNAEMALRIGEATRRAVHSQEIEGDDSQILVDFDRRGSRI